MMIADEKQFFEVLKPSKDVRKIIRHYFPGNMSSSQSPIDRKS